MHGKPGLWPTEPSLPIPTTHDGNNKSEAKEEDLTSHRNQSTKTTGGEHQPTPNQESPDNQQDPANSTLPTDLGSPIMRNLCSKEISSKVHPALFIHKSKDQTMCVAATAVQVDDSLITGKNNIMKSAQQEDGEKLRFGLLEDLPFGFLGLNYSKGQNGELVVYSKHYVKS